MALAATLEAEVNAVKAALLEAKWKTQCVRRRLLATIGSSTTFPSSTIPARLVAAGRLHDRLASRQGRGSPPPAVGYGRSRREAILRPALEQLALLLPPLSSVQLRKRGRGVPGYPGSGVGGKDFFLSGPPGVVM